MRHLRTIAARELKLGFRNPWSYSFMALFTLFQIALLLVQGEADLSGYTSAAGTMMNLIIYLLPLMTLLLGSFSLTTEKEEGGWRLLSSFSLSSRSFLWGKYVGLAGVLLLIIAFGFGFSGLLAVLFGHALSLASLGRFLLFSALLMLLFLGVATLLGAWCRNRWQALTYGVGIWFFFVLGWPTLLLAVLGLLPYLWIKPALVTLVFLNPAELTRLFFIVQMGGGSILGPEYYNWVTWMKLPAGSWAFAVVCLLWIAAAVELAVRLWERGRRRD